MVNCLLVYFMFLFSSWIFDRGVRQLKWHDRWISPDSNIIALTLRVSITHWTPQSVTIITVHSLAYYQVCYYITMSNLNDHQFEQICY